MGTIVDGFAIKNGYVTYDVFKIMPPYFGGAVYCEAKGDRLLAISLEGLGTGRKLADDLGQELCAILMGSDIGALAQQAIAGGADKVYVADTPSLKDLSVSLRSFLVRYFNSSFAFCAFTTLSNIVSNAP